MASLVITTAAAQTLAQSAARSGAPAPSLDLIRRAAATLAEGAARPAWAVLAVMVCTIAGLATVTSTRFGMWSEIKVFASVIWVLGLIALGFAAVEMRRLAMLVECYIVTSACAVAAPLLAAVLAKSALPLADTVFVQIDAVVGLSWYDIALWFRSQPDLSRIMSIVYGSIIWQPVMLLPMLALFRPGYLRVFTSAWCLSITVTLLIFPLVPAFGGYVHFGFKPEDFPDLLHSPAWSQVRVLEAARTGALVVLDRSILEGIVAFPSFHAAACMLLAAAWWHVPLLRYPALWLNAAMLLSTIPVGAHYVVDVIAGLAVAAGALWLVHAYFDRQDPLPAL